MKGLIGTMDVIFLLSCISLMFHSRQVQMQLLVRVGMNTWSGWRLCEDTANQRQWWGQIFAVRENNKDDNPCKGWCIFFYQAVSLCYWRFTFQPAGGFLVDPYACLVAISFKCNALSFLPFLYSVISRPTFYLLHYGGLLIYMKSRIRDMYEAVDISAVQQ